MRVKEWFSSLKNIIKTKNYNWIFKLIWTVPILVILIAIDWISKAAIVNSMELGETKEFIPGFIELHYILNPGAAGGMMEDMPTLAIVIATIVTIGLGFLYVFISNKSWSICISVVLAGSIGNLFARAWSQDGAVVDFLVWDVSWFNANYIFNFADLFVNIGIALAVLFALILIVKVIYFYVLKTKNEEYYEKVMTYYDEKDFLNSKYIKDKKDKSNRKTIKENHINELKLLKEELVKYKQELKLGKKNAKDNKDNRT